MYYSTPFSVVVRPHMEKLSLTPKKLRGMYLYQEIVPTTGK
jgi:hypothetical protein